MPLRCVSIRFPPHTHTKVNTKCCTVVSIISIISFRADRVCKLNNRRSLPFYRVYGWPSTYHLERFRSISPGCLARRAEIGELDASNLEIAKFRPRCFFSARDGEYCLHSIKVICVQDGCTFRARYRGND